MINKLVFVWAFYFKSFSPRRFHSRCPMGNNHYGKSWVNYFQIQSESGHWFFRFLYSGYMCKRLDNVLLNGCNSQFEVSNTPHLLGTERVNVCFMVITWICNCYSILLQSRYKTFVEVIWSDLNYSILFSHSIKC